MKKINAFYCIKTPSEWKERAILNDKPIKKRSRREIKIATFQIIGAAAMAVMLVAGGALTLYRSGEEHNINVGAQQSSVDSSESLDSVELTADLEKAQNALKQVVRDKEITAVGTYAGCDTDGTGYLLVDKIYIEKYTAKKGNVIQYINVNGYIGLEENSLVNFKLDFRTKDLTTGKYVYMDELKVGSKIAVGINCDDLNDWNTETIATGLDDVDYGDSIGTDYYSSLRSPLAYVYDIDTTKDTGKEKLDKLILDSIQHMGEDRVLQADNFSIVQNPVEKEWGFNIDTYVNFVQHINDNVNEYEADIVYPLVITPKESGKTMLVSTVGSSKKGVIIKVDGRYFSITSNYNDIVEQDGINNEWFSSESATVNHNRHYYFNENEWLVTVKFGKDLNTFFADDLKLYINEVQNDITYSDKTDDSECVITYHKLSETEVEVADKGEILGKDDSTE